MPGFQPTAHASLTEALNSNSAMTDLRPTEMLPLDLPGAPSIAGEDDAVRTEMLSLSSDSFPATEPSP